MKREIVILPGTVTLSVPCPRGKRIRIVSVRILFQAAIDGDQIIVEYQRTGQFFATMATAPFNANVVVATLFISGCDTYAREGTVTPATGVVVYDNNMTSVCGALPDVWFDFEVAVVVTGAVAATPTETHIVYEVEDIN